MLNQTNASISQFSGLSEPKHMILEDAWKDNTKSWRILARKNLAGEEVGEFQGTAGNIG